MTLMDKFSNKINRLICAKFWCAGSNHYLELILEHSTPDFSTSSSDDLVGRFILMCHWPETSMEETSMDYLGLEHIAITDG